MQVFPHVSTTPTPLSVLCCGHASVPSCEYNTDTTLCVMLREGTLAWPQHNTLSGVGVVLT
jgi:hypothetical protein